MSLPNEIWLPRSGMVGERAGGAGELGGESEDGGLLAAGWGSRELRAVSSGAHRQANSECAQRDERPSAVP